MPSERVADLPASDLLARLTRDRREHPARISEVLRARRRRPLWTDSGTLFLIAADHPARGVLKAGRDPRAMADREELLRRLLVALERPGVDGVMATPDVVEDLALLGALEGKVVFGSMNRGGLGGSVFELDDRFTAYAATQIQADGLDGGKMMVRVADDDPATLRTLSAAAEAINDLAFRRLPAMVEVFASRLVNGRAVNVEDAAALQRAVAIVSGLGRTSAYTWLKLPVVDDPPRGARPADLLPGTQRTGDGACRQRLRPDVIWGELPTVPRKLICNRTGQATRVEPPYARKGGRHRSREPTPVYSVSLFTNPQPSRPLATVHESGSVRRSKTSSRSLLRHPHPR